jgi:hypothetical protein
MGGGFYPLDDDAAYSDALEEGESWIAAGAEAPAESGSEPCPGVDVPGVGVTHGDCCASQGSPVRSGRAYVVGEVPQPLRDFVDGVELLDNRCSVCGRTQQEKAETMARRDGLLAELVFAARDLANRNIVAGRCNAVCLECGAIALVPAQLQHKRTCSTSRVLRTLSDLIALTLEPYGKETAKDGETGGAGDGIRPRGLKDRVCIKCGAKGGEWDAAQHSGRPNLALLGLNQVVGVGLDEDAYTLYTHRCESRLRGVDALFGDRTDAYESRVDLARQMNGGAR